MAIYRAHFRWSLAPQPDTVARYVEVLSRSTGYPCATTSVRQKAGGVSALLSFGRLSKNNLIELSQDQGLLEFAPVTFFWGHATRSVQQLGGIFTKPVVSDASGWTAREWKELSLMERTLIQLGVGASVM